MTQGLGVALAGISIELWAVMMALFGGNGTISFFAGTIGLGIGIGGGLMAEVRPSSTALHSAA